MKKVTLLFVLIACLLSVGATRRKADNRNLVKKTKPTKESKKENPAPEIPSEGTQERNFQLIEKISETCANCRKRKPTLIDEYMMSSADQEASKVLIEQIREIIPDSSVRTLNPDLSNTLDDYLITSVLLLLPFPNYNGMAMISNSASREILHFIINFHEQILEFSEIYSMKKEVLAMIYAKIIGEQLSKPKESKMLKIANYKTFNKVANEIQNFFMQREIYLDYIIFSLQNTIMKPRAFDMEIKKIYLEGSTVFFSLLERIIKENIKDSNSILTAIKEKLISISKKYERSKKELHEKLQMFLNLHRPENIPGDIFVMEVQTEINAEIVKQLEQFKEFEKNREQRLDNNYIVALTVLAETLPKKLQGIFKTSKKKTIMENFVYKAIFENLYYTSIGLTLMVIQVLACQFSLKFKSNNAIEEIDVFIGKIKEMTAELNVGLAIEHPKDVVPLAIQSKKAQLDDTPVCNTQNQYFVPEILDEIDSDVSSWFCQCGNVNELSESV
ncbi:hypothetical protein O9G_004062 [Rozella allomycis CSF55]|uniref:Uncharacterized protein n=1 Tax=Rozella allomycis (strain CSF55) TaxID=988480 RepID=A0A075AVM4_ROZAC|nr:hypothetical protein O9G_004062 [Rozella allomycis CSF55]|eukprot:EPZ34185.1 hypothetical protein O9G_004062 [Rozella allomycis CSF55]